MSLVLDVSLLGLENDFPDKFYILHHPPSQCYGCYQWGDIHGLACFSTEGGAHRFGEWFDLTHMRTEELSFEQARTVAKDRPLPINCLMLLDDIADPRIHYVR